MEKITSIRALTKALFLTPSLLLTSAQNLQTVDSYTSSDLAIISRQLAAKKSRFASQDLRRYSNHYTMLAFRDQTGSSEVHEHEADIFVIQKGSAELLSGGHIVAGHLQKAGEIRGTSIQGGEKRPLAPGDIVHIPAGMPHQLLVTPGTPLTYFVIKVTGQ